MIRHLSPATHLALIGADIVVLDARENAYFCLPGAAAQVRLGPDGVTFEDEELAGDFDQAGFLAEKPRSSTVLPTPPSRDLAMAVAQRVAMDDVVLILAAWITMAFSYHILPFDRLVDQARRSRQPEPGQGLDEDLTGLVATFERILPWLPFQGLCLYRAFLLLRILRWRGHDARWVFGVRTWPFQAHCWLQAGEVALDDTADRLIGFTPIMVA